MNWYRSLETATFKSPLDSRSAGSSIASVVFYRQPSTPQKEPETPDNNWLFAGSPSETEGWERAMESQG